MKEFGIVSSVKGYGRLFIDTFNRANESLTAAPDGTKWSILRGVWSIVSNKVSTSSDASEYPLAVVGMASQNVDISLKDISQGTTAALWVTDSGNWWGLGIDQITLVGDNNNATGCDCTTCTNTNYNSFYYDCGDNYCTGTNYVYCCNVTGNRYCRAYGGNCSKYASAPYRCVAWFTAWCTAYNAGNCNENPPYCVSGYYNYKCGDNYCVGYAVAGYYNYTCGCTTCYPQYIRIIKSASNAVSTVVSEFIHNSKTIKSIKLLVRGNQVTAKVYENTDLTGQIGSDLVYTPTDVAITPRYGIMVKPSSYSQGNTSGEIQIENK